ASAAPLLAELPPEGCALDDVLSEVERRLILQALSRTGGVRKAAARLLGVTFRSLRYRLAEHGLRPDRAPPARRCRFFALWGVTVGVLAVHSHRRVLVRPVPRGADKERSVIGARRIPRAASGRGFTLVELLITVAMIGVLAALGLVGYRKFIHSAQSSEARGV